jgi:hypothetical protein
MRDTSVMDRHCFNADPYPDLAFHSNADPYSDLAFHSNDDPDPEPSFHFYAEPEPDPGPATNDGNLRSLVCRPSCLHWPSTAPFCHI